MGINGSSFRHYLSELCGHQAKWNRSRQCVLLWQACRLACVEALAGGVFPSVREVMARTFRLFQRLLQGRWLRGTSKQQGTIQRTLIGQNPKSKPNANSLRVRSPATLQAVGSFRSRQLSIQAKDLRVDVGTARPSCCMLLLSSSKNRRWIENDGELSRSNSGYFHRGR
jgi:hypothetical protein